MRKFEYEITKHPASEFKHLVYFCSDNGECNIDQLPADQLTIMKDILNDRGSQGWELVQVSFGEDGLIAFWKKEV